MEPKFYITLLQKGKIKCLYCCILAIIGWLIGKYFWLPLDICVAMVSTVYLFFGSLIAKIEWVKVNGMVIVLLLMLWMGIGWSKTLGMVSNSYPYYFFSVISSFAGCVLIIILSFWFERIGFLPLKKYFVYMGRYSLIILCFHFLELRIVPWEILDVNILLACILKVSFLSIIPIAICRIPYLSRVYKLN